MGGAATVAAMAASTSSSSYGSLPALPRDDRTAPDDPARWPGRRRGEPPVPTTAVEPDASFERIQLDATSWVDVVRGWLREPDALFTRLHEDGRWVQASNFRYERRVAEPRLGGRWPSDPAVESVRKDLHRALVDRYRVPLDRGALVLYRDGRDSVAFHRDREMRWLDDTVIAIATLGAQRPFLLRPRAGRDEDLDAPDRGATHDLAPAAGDLVVLGGRCQADWLHAVPKVARPTRPRISIQWRWTSRRGRPEQGPNFGDARYFSS